MGNNQFSSDYFLVRFKSAICGQENPSIFSTFILSVFGLHTL